MSLKRLLRGNITKRALRRILTDALNSRFLRAEAPREGLQTAHEIKMAAIKDAGKKGRLNGKVAIVTGGASGLGRATAILFAHQGAKIVVADLKRGAVDEITSAGGDALYLETDLLHDKQVDRMVRETIDAYGRIDVLVNNAGGVIPGSVTELSTEQWERNLNLNVTSAYRCCHYSIPHMIQSGNGGSVIMTSSIQGVCGIVDHAGYAAAKGALIALTRQNARQYARFGIRTNCVSPGVILTPICEHEEDIKWKIKTVTEYTPLGILGVPEDIAYLNLFLASDESSYITGINVVADGGITMRGT